MVIQPQTYSTQNGLTNNVPNGPRKRSRDTMENQINNLNIVRHNTIHIPLQSFATQIFGNNLKSLLETDLILSKFSKKIKMEIAARQKESPRTMCDDVEAVLMKQLKENEEEILDVVKLNKALQGRVCLYAENQLLKVVENNMEAMTRFLNVNTILPNDTKQGLPASDGVVADSVNSEKNEGVVRGGSQ